jgi:two-component system CheB/CheR fusion protein
VDSQLEIFVLEDHEDTTSVLCGLLRDWGHAVRDASTVRGAKDALVARRPDVFLCDIRLPDGDGCELMCTLGAAAPSFAIAMSGLGTPADKARSLSAGFRSHLVKPFEMDELRALLGEAAIELGRENPSI